MPASNTFMSIWSLGRPRTLRSSQAFISIDSKSRTANIRSSSTRAGTEKREYWKEKFIRDGKELSWGQAMDVFRDSSGRPGPSTWVAGHYPARTGGLSGGRRELVRSVGLRGICRQEPAGDRAVVPGGAESVAKYIMPLSNFSAAPAPVGTYQGIGPFGTYDMAGNVVGMVPQRIRRR